MNIHKNARLTPEAIVQGRRRLPADHFANGLNGSLRPRAF